MATGKDEIAAFSSLLLALNGSLLGDEPWRDFLLELRDHIQAKHATLILTPPHAPGLGTMITPTAPKAEVRAYLDRFLAIDPFVGLPEGEVVALFEFVGEAKLRDSAYYRDWFAHIDGSHVLGVDIRVSSGFEARLRATREPGGNPFDAAERARVACIVPHLRQAIELFQRIETSRSEHAVMTGAIEQFAVGTVMLDHSLNVLKMNEVAAGILAQRDGIDLVGQRIVLTTPTLDTGFRTWLKAALIDPQAGRQIFLAERPSGRRDFCLVARQIDVPDFMHTGTAPAIALLLGDPERAQTVDAATVRELLALTPMESEISASVANGASVIETAKMLGITENTVRAHLRSIFAKTGVSRQPQLVHLIHTSLPELALTRRSN